MSKVVLTFDLDGETLWLARDPGNLHRPVTLSQGAYGPRVGVPLILELLSAHRIKATFFVPGWVAERYPRVVETILGEDHEIGFHGYMHEWPHTLSYEEERGVFERGLTILRGVTGDLPKGYRAPAWELSPNTLRFLIEYHFLYSSNFMDAHQPYYHHLSEGGRLVEIPVSWVCDDAPFFLYALNLSGRQISSPSSVKDIWKGEFDSLHRRGLPMTLTMHPQLIGRPSRLDMLDELLSYIHQKGGQFITAMEMAEKFTKESCNPTNEVTKI
ncbi:MAG: polysaccharide deacetylase [Bacillota bacterium]